MLVVSFVLVTLIINEPKYFYLNNYVEKEFFESYQQTFSEDDYFKIASHGSGTCTLIHR